MQVVYMLKVLQQVYNLQKVLQHILHYVTGILTTYSGRGATFYTRIFGVDKKISISYQKSFWKIKFIIQDLKFFCSIINKDDN